MLLLLLSFFAGILTVLAPCVLPLLPVIIGGSLTGGSKLKPYMIILGLMVSVILFTLLVKFSSTLLGIDKQVWLSISAGILILFGIVMIFPVVWDKISIKLGFEKSNNLLQSQIGNKGVIGDMVLGASLGPVFSSCSPTFAIVLAVVLPTSFAVGLLNIIAYSLGLGVVLLSIAILGIKLIKKLKWAADPRGWFKKIVGVLIILTGLAIITGFDKVVETKILDAGYGNFTEFELKLLEKTEYY